MFGKTYYHESVKKYVILFGTLFNDIWINRKDNTGKTIQSMKVPLSYGPREKFLARLEGDPNLDQAFAVVLPRMGFEITGFGYDPERKLHTIGKYIKTENVANTQRKSLWNPVPYNINFQLSIFTKATEDGLMIVEQILPFYTPEWNTTIRLIDDPEVVIDVPLVLNNVNSDDVYEGNFEERRALVWTLDFTMKCLLFGPDKTQGIIKTVITDLYGDIPE